jgi:hypothetical protein
MNLCFTFPASARHLLPAAITRFSWELIFDKKLQPSAPPFLAPGPIPEL